MREIIEKIVIFAIIGIILGLAITAIVLFSQQECVSYHKETRIRMPIGMVSGSISIPLGSATQEEVVVCDEWVTKK
jgi:hypothetical protein